MQSQGSTSSQPSFNSLSSSESLLLSDSDQVEDDTDVFLTDGGSSSSSSRGAVASRDGGSESPGSQWTCDGFTDKEDEEEAAGAAYRSERGGKGDGGDEADNSGPTPRSHGDQLFAQKCAELQGFVRPLLELLNGLKRGRFDRGLSGFQQSVAMDRIQRIVGVLQRPNIGEKYLNTLLQVEMMLKLWFPQIPTKLVSAPSSGATSPARSLQDSSTSTPPHKHRDQLHIPVKKRRLSWTGADTPTPSPVLPKCPHITAEAKRPKRDHDDREESPAPPPPPLPPPPPPALEPEANQSPGGVACEIPLTEDAKGKDGGGEEGAKPATLKSGHGSEPSLTWVHVAPIPSPRKASGENQPVSAVPPPLTRRGSPAMQDSAISSTTPVKQPKNQKKPTRCQSLPVAGQQSDTDATCEGQSQSPPRACPPPLET